MVVAPERRPMTNVEELSMRKKFTVLSTTAIAGLLLVGCASGAQTRTQENQTVNGEIFSVEDPWVRATEETMETDHDHSMTGAFVHLTNVSGEDQTIVGASSDGANLVELHEVIDDGGVNIMQEKKGGFPIAVDETYELNPGQDHIMLMELVDDIQPGDLIDITLELENGDTQTIEFVAKEYVGAQENYGDLEHHDHDH